METETEQMREKKEAAFQFHMALILVSSNVVSLKTYLLNMYYVIGFVN